MTSGVDVSVEGVNLSYGTNHVLKDVDLAIRPGEFFAFLGPSGCGKTTLLRLIAGFVAADTGRVSINGADVSWLPPWKRDVGMVFQSYALWPHMTVAKNVAFGLEERRLPRAEIASRVEQALELVGLREFGARRPSQLSGGQQQRVALARTIAIEPKVLLLDEPMSNLDAQLRVQVRRELRNLQKGLGITTIFVTHDQEEANTICDRIAVMSEGRVQQIGTPIELYERPANLFVAGFIGTANIIEGRFCDGGRAYEVPGGLKVPVPPSVMPGSGSKLVFRPQVARIGAAGADPHPHSVTAAGRLVHREFFGATIRYGVMLGDTEILVDAPFEPGMRMHELGTDVSVSLPLGSLVWLDYRRDTL